MYYITRCEPTLYDPKNPNALPPKIKNKEVAKGISRATIKNQMRHDMYLEMFHEKPLQRLINRAICSKLHNVYSIEVEKRSLHHYDDKRYLLDNLEDGTPNSNTNAFGHYLLPAAGITLNSPDAGQGLVISVRFFPRLDRKMQRPTL